MEVFANQHGMRVLPRSESPWGISADFFKVSNFAVHLFQV